MASKLADLKQELYTKFPAVEKVVDKVEHLPNWVWPTALVLLFSFYYLYPYFVTYKDLRDIPAPFPAQFSNLWLFRVARGGKRSKTVDQLHKELGTLVRIQPNHVSIADDAAIKAIYGHGNGFVSSSSSSSSSQASW